RAPRPRSGGGALLHPQQGHHHALAAHRAPSARLDELPRDHRLTVTVEGDTMRIAGAPISWGVCEVPGWGHQMSPDRVLTEMAGLGIGATEFGPQGWLPEAPAARSAALRPYGLTAVGAFVPVVLHDPAHDPVPEVDR